MLISREYEARSFPSFRPHLNSHSLLPQVSGRQQAPPSPRSAPLLPLSATTRTEGRISAAVSTSVTTQLFIYLQSSIKVCGDNAQYSGRRVGHAGLMPADTVWLYMCDIAHHG